MKQEHTVLLVGDSVRHYLL